MSTTKAAPTVSLGKLKVNVPVPSGKEIGLPGPPKNPTNPTGLSTTVRTTSTLPVASLVIV